MFRTARVLLTASLLLAFAMSGISQTTQSDELVRDRLSEVTMEKLAKVCQSTQAQIRDDSDIHDAMDRSINSAFCYGYLTAFLQMNGAPLCTPPGVTYGQIVKIYLKYANAHPGQLDEQANITLMFALQDAFPFTGKTPNGVGICPSQQ